MKSLFFRSHKINNLENTSLVFNIRLKSSLKLPVIQHKYVTNVNLRVKIYA